MRSSLKILLFGTAAPGFPSCRNAPFLRNKTLLAITAALALLPGMTHAQWLSGYELRKSLAINAGVGAGTDYQVQVKVGESSGAVGYNIHLGGNALNFPNDVRFTSNDGSTNLGHWLESTTGSTPNRIATFWVKVNTDLNNSQSIYTYYRKSGDASGSNGDSTFSFFDDFSGGAIDGAKWIIDSSTGWSVTGGELNGTNTAGRITSQTTFNSGVILETKYRSVTRPSNGNMVFGFFTSTSDSFGWLNHPGGDYYRSNSSWTGIGNECNVPVIASIAAKSSTLVDFYVYRQDNGAVWHNKPNNTNTVANERIALGYRYDNALSGQTYNGFWDWVRVRKYASTVPTLGAVGAEEVFAPVVTLTAPAHGSQFVPGSTPTATATVTGGTPPYSVSFYKTFNNGSPVLAGTVSSSPYSINLGALANGDYTIYAQVTDSKSPMPATSSSATHSFIIGPDTAPPTPNPMTFAVTPVSVSETSIRVIASTATDLVSSPVQYYFENTTNSTNSGWISSPMWTQSGLTLGETYGYRVKARDSASPTPNETTFSNISNATAAAPGSRPVAIVNPGFEIPALTDGGSISNVWGWSRIGSGFYAWNPYSSSYPTEAPEGKNLGVLFLASAYSGCSQVLQGAEGQFQADATYELKVKVGGGCDVFGVPRPYDGYIVQLVVNGSVIAQDENSRPPANGSFTTTSIKYTYNPAHAALVGYPMEIRLLTKGVTAGLGLVSFDDVQLTYSTSNPVAVHGGPYRVSQGNSLTLIGSASLPSPGATITSYEWDLDSRNDNLDFIPNLTGATPAPISYATLTGTYGMAPGTNTIRLRVTDSAGMTAVSTATVSIYTLCTYVGPSGNGMSDDWNVKSKWSGGTVPSGLVDVSIPASFNVTTASVTVPSYSGNLSLGTGSTLNLGWIATSSLFYISLGTPGSTVLTMASGSSLNFRSGDVAYFPEIVLTGNASITLGSSTQPGAQGSFNYPITGAYRLSFNGNGHGSCIANLNATNTFSEIYTAGGPYVDGGVTIQGNAPGSLGTGNLTFDALGSGGNSCLLVINVPNAMADTAILSMNGNSATKITMNANDTIARLVINGVQMPAGTYGGSSSAATFKQTWITGTGILTVTDGAATYWDTNGASAGAGGATPTGNWDSASSLWSTSSAGTATATPWIAGSSAFFAAGSDATGSYTVSVGDSNAISISNVKATVTGNSGTSNMNVTESNWALSGGNAVVVLFSAKNATAFTATYGGQPMTVANYKDANNVYNGIAYIIDPLSSTGNVAMSATYGFVNSNNVLRYAYRLLSLSNVASAGPAVSRNSAGTLTYTTNTNNSYVFGVASNNNWYGDNISAVGKVSNIFFQGNPGYYNTLFVHGPVALAGPNTDSYNGSITGAITLPFHAKTTPNPLLPGSGQTISGLTFEEGNVTISGSSLLMQTSSQFNSASGVTATVSSKISGVSNSDLIKKGLGTVVLSNNANNYTGTTSVMGGTLRLGTTNAIPNTGVIISGETAGVTPILDLNGNSCTVSSLTLGGSSSTSGSSVTTGAGTLTLGGNVNFNNENSPLGGTIAGLLSLGSTTRTFSIKDSPTAASDLTVSAPISGTGGLIKTEFGTLLLTGNNSYTGLTTVNSGLLVLSGSNSGATGGIAVNSYASVRFDAPASINGTGANLTINEGGLASFGPSFGSGNLASALARINPSSTGVVAIDNYSGTNFNFSNSNLQNVYLGALADLTYTGTFTPNSTGYRIGGGTGTITLSGANALTGSSNLLVGGSVVITNLNNSFSGATTINSSGRLQLGAGGTTGSISSSSVTNNGLLVFSRSGTITQGTNFWSVISGSGTLQQSGPGVLVLNANNTYSGGTNLVSGTLRLDHENAIGSGPLSVYAGTLDAFSALTLTSNNPVTLWSSFSFGDTADLNMGTGIVNNAGNNTITLNGTNSTTLTFGGVMKNLYNGSQTLTVNGAGNTLVLGGYDMSSDPNGYLQSITIGGTGDVSITGPVNDWTYIEIDPFNPNNSIYELRFGTLTKTGSGTLKLSANNNYSGDTIVAGGALHLHSGTQISPIYVNNGGILAFTLGNTITSSETLTLIDGHKIRIIGIVDTEVSSYTLMSASTISGGAPTLETPIDGYKLEIAGNELRLSKNDQTPPELLDILNDKGNGESVGPILPGTLVTYTVIFNEDIKDGSLTSADFINAGTSAISFGTIMEISPGVFTVEVTPQVGTLQLRIRSDPNPLSPIEDNADNDLVVPLTDDTTINVALPPNDWLTGSDIVDDRGGAPVRPNAVVTYTVYFDEDIDHTTVEATDFVNAAAIDPCSYTIGTITEISPGVFTVPVTPTNVGNLQLGISTSAIISNPSAANLQVVPAIVDNTTITVADSYAIWAGVGNDFDGDANGDGIANGLAWLLGATNPDQDARNLLPTANEEAGDLTLIFTTLNASARGTASIKVQYSTDLAVASWGGSHQAEVPTATGTSTVNGIEFQIQPLTGDYISVLARIPASAAGTGKKLFSRISATSPTP